MIERTEMQLFESLATFMEAKAVVEVGVAHGDGTMYLCRAARRTGGHVYGFDVWNRHGLRKQFKSFSCLAKVGDKLRAKGYDNFTLTQIDTVVEKEKFKRLLDSYCPGGIDLAFIDGDHSYLGVKSDFSVVYPRLKVTGVVAFHDTLMIDGCREFVLDLRTKYFDGTFDVVDLPFGCHSNRRVGISLLVKRSYPVIDAPITEVCGSVSTERQIEAAETFWLAKECAQNPKDMDTLLNTPDAMQFENLGDHKSRRKYE